MKYNSPKPKRVLYSEPKNYKYWIYYMEYRRRKIWLPQNEDGLVAHTKKKKKKRGRRPIEEMLNLSMQ